MWRRLPAWRLNGGRGKAMPTLPNPRNQGRHTPQCTQFAFQNFVVQLNLSCYYSRGSDQDKEITDSAGYNKIRPQIPSETVNNLLSANQASSRYMFCCRYSLLDTWMQVPGIKHNQTKYWLCSFNVGITQLKGLVQECSSSHCSQKPNTIKGMKIITSVIRQCQGKRF
jgi:hypothetical protein